MIHDLCLRCAVGFSAYDVLSVHTYPLGTLSGSIPPDQTLPKDYTFACRQTRIHRLYCSQ